MQGGQDRDYPRQVAPRQLLQGQWRCIAVGTDAPKLLDHVLDDEDAALPSFASVEVSDGTAFSADEDEN